MKKLLVLTVFLLGMYGSIKAQKTPISLDELLGRITIEMTEEEYFEEFKNELRLKDSLDFDYVVSDELAASLLGDINNLQQISHESGADNEETVVSQIDETWVIDVEVSGFGKCLALMAPAEQGKMLWILPHSSMQNKQSSFLLQQAKTTMGKYATSDIIDFVSTDATSLHTGLWNKGILMIVQSATEAQCITLLGFLYSSDQLSEADMKMAAEYLRTGTIPEGEPESSEEAFVFPPIRVAQWGDSMRTVMQKEGKYDELTRYVISQGIGDRYMFYDKISGYESAVTYAFDDSDRAYILMYSLNNIANESCITAYNNLKYALSQKYGEPQSDDVNKRYIYTEEDWYQVYYGNLSYEANWITDDFVSITLELTTLSNRISCSIRYVYLPLLMLQQEKEQANL